MNYNVLFDNVLVKPLTEEGQIIYAGDQGEPIRGTAVSVGDGKNGDDMVICVEDVVWFDPTRAKKVKLEEKDYYIVDQHNIWFVEEE